MFPTQKQPINEMGYGMNTTTNLYGANVKNKVMKNITDGKIFIDIDDADKVQEDYVIESVDIETVDQEPSKMKKHYYVENIKTGNFGTSSAKEEVFFQEQAKKEDKMYTKENPESNLLEMLRQLDSSFLKFGYFFQGMAPGVFVLQWFIQVIGISDFEEYKKFILRVSQIGYICVIFSFFATWGIYYNTKLTLNHLKKMGRGQISDDLNASKNMTLAASICYSIIYICILLDQRNIGKLSAYYNTTDGSTQKTIHTIFLSIELQAAIAAWIVQTCFSNDKKYIRPHW